MTLMGGLDNGRFGWSSLPAWSVPVGVLPHVLGQLPVAYLVRTELEDRTLQRELPGYAEYARSTRYRLVPFVW